MNKPNMVNAPEGLNQVRFQRRPKGLSLAITLFRRMSHTLKIVSRQNCWSMGSVAGLFNF